jgi:hypothetical protein
MEFGDHVGPVFTRSPVLYEHGIAHYRLRYRNVRDPLVERLLAYDHSMLLPFPILINSQIQKRKKIALLGLFALGTFITVIQVFRLRTIGSLSNYLDSSSLIMWSTVENNLGIIVACIPTLAPLFKYFAEKTQKSSTANTAASRVKSMFPLKSWRGTGNGTFQLSSNGYKASQANGPSEDEGELLDSVRGGTIKKTTKVVVSSSASAESRV